jgi:threonine dehydrogenase-like Zn-dependent dehydrogenase
MVAAARRGSPRVLIVIEPDAARRELAEACGADVSLDPGAPDILADVRACAGGDGCDVFIEASGNPAAAELAIDAVRPLGTVVAFGAMRDRVSVDWNAIGDGKELDVRGSHLSPYAFPPAIALIASGALPMQRIVTHQLPLEEFEQGIGLVADGRESIKVVLRPGTAVHDEET